MLSNGCSTHGLNSKRHHCECISSSIFHTDPCSGMTELLDFDTCSLACHAGSELVLFCLFVEIKSTRGQKQQQTSRAPSLMQPKPRQNQEHGLQGRWILLCAAQRLNGKPGQSSRFSWPACHNHPSHAEQAVLLGTASRT